MRDDLARLLEKVDLALGSAAGVIEPCKLAPLIDSVKAVRTRLAYPDDVLVAALAGGTGSGKSSVFNAFCDEELVDTGGVRPTTSEPASAVPAAVGSAMDGYLDRLGVNERHQYEGGGICLLDLPDTDSVETAHRHRADAILPLVDLVVWVTDPEKYRDARLHQEYLEPMSAHAAQFIFVVNQVDRLHPGQVDQVLDDLQAALVEDGIDRPVIIPMSAAPPSGPPIGLTEFTGALESKGYETATLYDKLLTDVATTSQALETESGSGLDFDTRASATIEEATANLVSGDAEGATDALTGFLEALADGIGGVTEEKIEVVAAAVPAHVRRIEAELTPDPPGRVSWWRRKRTEDTSEKTAKARSLLTDALIRPVRAVLARRALAVASVAELALEVESLRSRARG